MSCLSHPTEPPNMAQFCMAGNPDSRDVKDWNIRLYH